MGHCSRQLCIRLHDALASCVVVAPELVLCLMVLCCVVPWHCVQVGAGVAVLAAQVASSRRSASSSSTLNVG